MNSAAEDPPVQQLYQIFTDCNIRNCRVLMQIRSYVNVESLTFFLGCGTSCHWNWDQLTLWSCLNRDWKHDCSLKPSALTKSSCLTPCGFAWRLSGFLLLLVAVFFPGFLLFRCPWSSWCLPSSPLVPVDSWYLLLFFYWWWYLWISSGPSWVLLLFLVFLVSTFYL